MPTDANENMPAPRRSAGRIFANLTSIWLLCITEVALVAGLVVGLYVPAQVVQAYDDFDAELPGITMAVLNLGSTACALVIGVIALALLVKELLIKKPAVKLVINVIFLVLALVQVGVFVVAMFLPMLNLMQSMTQ